MRKKFSSLMIYFTTGQEDEFLNGEIELNSDFMIIFVKEGIIEIEVEYVINLKLVNLFKLIK